MSHAYFINIIAYAYKAYTLIGLCATFCHSQGWCFRKGGPLSANLMFHWLTVLPIIWIGDVWFWLRVFWGWLYRQVDTSQRSWNTSSIQWNLVLILRLTSRSVTPRPVVQIGKKLPKYLVFFFRKNRVIAAEPKSGGSNVHPFPRRKTRMFTSNGMRGKSISNFQMISRWEGKKHMCDLRPGRKESPWFP